MKDILFLFEMMILSEYVGLRILSLKIFSRFARFPISNLLQFKDCIQGCVSTVFSDNDVRTHVSTLQSLYDDYLALRGEISTKAISTEPN